MARGRDLHQALKTERVGEANGAGVNFVLVKLQWGRDDVGFGLHADPRSWTTAGVQTPDLLGYLGFKREPNCGFVGGECYARMVDEGFALDAFAPAFARSYQALQQAENHLEACGYPFDRREGWGIFFHRESGGRHRPNAGGDGHTGAKIERMKEAEDEAFRFAFSWMEGRDKGWTIHCRPKHPPLSSEVAGVFDFLDLRRFAECPHFDFDECYWRFIPYQGRTDSFFDNNAGVAHGWFDAQATRFSPGVEQLLAAHAAMEPFGMQLLPSVPGTTDRKKQVSVGGSISLSGTVVATKTETFPQVPGERAFEYDVAISFAGTERERAEALATQVRDAGFNVFYDAFYPEHLWGKDLVMLFDDVFRKRSRYAVVFVSSEYANRMWTIQELRSALARAVEEKGKEYILPIKVDDTDLPGLPPTLGYLALSEHGIDNVAEILLKKLRGES